MSQLLERGLRRQRAIQQSRSTAWVMFIIMLSIGFSALASLVVALVAGGAVSLSGTASVVIAIAALWIAGHLFAEARRLGRLLKDPESIMGSDRGTDLVSGIHWWRLNPFSGRRN